MTTPQHIDISQEQSLATACHIAAKWWADQLAGVPKLDNGDATTAGFLAVFGEHRRPACSDPEKLKLFEEALAGSLKEEFSKSDWSMRCGTSTGVDYHPDHLLREALDKAGISAGMTDLPWKSSTRVFADRVEIRNGYGASAHIITVAEVLKAETDTQKSSVSLPKAAEAIPTDEVRAKLNNMHGGLSPEIREFGRLLADRLHGTDALLPQGFHLAAHLLLYDISTGVDGFSGESIKSSLVGAKPIVLRGLEEYIPNLAETTCPPDFARAVRDIAITIKNVVG